MEWEDLWQLLELKTYIVGHGGCSAGSYLADTTSPIPSNCAVVMFNGVGQNEIAMIGTLFFHQTLLTLLLQH